MLWHDFCVNGPVLRETQVTSFVGPVFPMGTDTSRDLRAPDVDSPYQSILQTSQEWSLKKEVALLIDCLGRTVRQASPSLSNEGQKSF